MNREVKGRPKFNLKVIGVTAIMLLTIPAYTVIQNLSGSKPTSSSQPQFEVTTDEELMIKAAVLNWLKEYLAGPESLEITSWGEVLEIREGFGVSIAYKSENAVGGGDFVLDKQADGSFRVRGKF